MRDAFRRNGGYMDGGNTSVEMSKMDNKIPRYYRGHDMDELFEKEVKGQLTQEERGIITEAFNVHYPPPKENKPSSGRENDRRPVHVEPLF